MSRVLRGFRVRLKPTKREEAQMLATVKACIWAWNWALDINTKLTDRAKPRMIGYELRAEFSKLRRETSRFDWISTNNIPIKSINETFNCFEKAYRRCYVAVKHQKHGKYESLIKNSDGTPWYVRIRHPYRKNEEKILKSPHFGYPEAAHRVYFKDNKHVCLSKLNNMRCNWTYKNVKLPTGTSSASQIKNPHVIFDHGFWYLCFVMYIDVQKPQLNDFSVGVDVGLKQLATISYTITNPTTGNKEHRFKMYENINKSYRIKRKERRKRHLQRKRSRAWRKNGNKSNTCGVKKLKKAIDKLEKKQTDMRNDFIQKMTLDIVKIYPRRIVCEDLKVQKMMSNHHFAYHIMIAKWAMIRMCLTYKAEAMAIKVVAANTMFPSSKLCSCCGNKRKDLKLSDRTYICPCCGLIIDRDINAARNLEQYIEPKSLVPKKPKKTKSFHKKTLTKKKKAALEVLMAVLQLRINGLYT